MPCIHIITLRIEPTPAADTSTLADKIQSAIRAAFNLRVPVKTVPADSLHRFELKSKRGVRE